MRNCSPVPCGYTSYRVFQLPQKQLHARKRGKGAKQLLFAQLQPRFGRPSELPDILIAIKAAACAKKEKRSRAVAFCATNFPNNPRNPWNVSGTHKRNGRSGMRKARTSLRPGKVKKYASVADRVRQKPENETDRISSWTVKDTDKARTGTRGATEKQRRGNG